MFGFLKKGFSTAMTFFSYNVLNVTLLKYISVNNQESKNKREKKKLKSAITNLYFILIVLK